jgi:hypothetical protein
MASGFSDSRRKSVLNMSGGKCWYCGNSLTIDTLTVDHVLPVAEGGSNDPQNLHGAIEHTKRAYPRRTLLIPQVNANPIPLPHKLLNFIREQWTRAGMLPLFHTAPMVFDRRDTAREAEVIKQHWPKTDKPVLMMNLSGHSSPYRFQTEMRDWVASALPQYTIMDVSDVRFPRFLDILPLLEKAAALLSIDSALIHLAQATKTPTAVMSKDTTWYQSEPKSHWIAHVSYPMSVTVEGRMKLLKALSQPSIFMGKLVRSLK